MAQNCLIKLLKIMTEAKREGAAAEEERKEEEEGKESIRRRWANIE